MATSAELRHGAGLDQDRVRDVLDRMISDGGAAMAGLCTSLGDRLGLYKALAGAGPLTSAQLAARTGLVERYVREWLAAQVAGEYVTYPPETDVYLLPDEHAAVLADPEQPSYAAGPSTMLQGVYATEDGLMEAFRTGEGMGWEGGTHVGAVRRHREVLPARLCGRARPGAVRAGGCGGEAGARRDRRGRRVRLRLHHDALTTLGVCARPRTPACDAFWPSWTS
ncbi:hypothetical protein [Streptomyces halobius]|uniref:S-adenosylmethionine-dependent methyltransferase Rv2258c-like winged HTH domain-containing protein n=1 Tax=Streptomyces halobius TaxID=2879846 RepID=A0ABY4MJC9_9ACTN|nr:hypothetical protein [Streptomyces halobius]UQA96436.1 hypothetical protein K9S39_35225 [Streptomyces halobius]